MLKTPASFVLTSLRGSTLKRTFRRSGTLAGLIRSPRSLLGVNGHTECGSYLLASSLAADSLNSRFEHPVWSAPVATDMRTSETLTYHSIFPAACQPWLIS